MLNVKNSFRENSRTIGGGVFVSSKLVFSYISCPNVFSRTLIFFAQLFFLSLSSQTGGEKGSRSISQLIKLSYDSIAQLTVG